MSDLGHNLWSADGKPLLGETAQSFAARRWKARQAVVEIGSPNGVRCHKFNDAATGHVGTGMPEMHKGVCAGLSAREPKTAQFKGWSVRILSTGGYFLAASLQPLRRAALELKVYARGEFGR